MVNKSVKSQLAKLMATENLMVEHCNDATASFDVVNRILRLPTWKDDVSGHVYDLMVGHEIAHALWTPSDKDSLPNAAKEVCADDPKLGHHYVNVIEDARIERLVKTEYPGLRLSFSKGYQELADRDFFDSKGRDLDSYLLIDRLNLYCKLGTLSGVVLSEQEQALVDEVNQAMTFPEVVAIAKKVLGYCQEEQKEKEVQLQKMLAEGDDDDAGRDSEEDEEVDNDSTEGSGYNRYDSFSDPRTDNVGEDAGSDGASGTGRGGTNDGGNVYGTASVPNQSDENDLAPKTQEAFDQQIQEVLIDYNKTNVYVTVPDVDLKRIIYTYKEVHKNLKHHWLGRPGEDYNREQPKDLIEHGKRSLAKFKRESEKTVAYLAKEFEMRKQASQYSRVSIAKTGVVDTNKLHMYKYNEDLFRRVATLPDGKNHGLVMFLDQSGSMAPSMHGTIFQLMNLVMFCRRVQIPFDVYGFTDAGTQLRCPDVKTKDMDVANANYKHHDLLVCSNFALKQYFSSDMKAGEFQEAMVNMMLLGNYWKHEYGNRKLGRYTREERMNETPYSIPSDERLHGTPLAETIMSAIKIVPTFREKYKVEVVNTVFLSDGEGWYQPMYHDLPESLQQRHQSQAWLPEQWTRNFIVFRGHSHDEDPEAQLVLQDPVTKKTYTQSDGMRSLGKRYYDINQLLFEILKDRGGCNVIGFYIAEGQGRATMSNLIKDKCGAKDESTIHELWLQFRKQKYLVGTCEGYNEYYILAGGKAIAEGTEELSVEPTMTARQMMKQFMKHNQSKVKNRVVLSKFVDMIA